MLVRPEWDPLVPCAPAPRALHSHTRPALRRTRPTPRATHPASHCAPPEPRAALLVPRQANSIGRQQVQKHMLQPYVSCVPDVY
jgi:hypothetical protein